MELYVWSGKDITDAYGGDGFLGIVAESIEGAKVAIREYCERAQGMGIEPQPAMPFNQDRDLNKLTPPEQEAFERWRQEREETHARNAVRIEMLAADILTNRGLEPPDSDGCYGWLWDSILARNPDRILPITLGKVLVASWGYEG